MPKTIRNLYDKKLTFENLLKANDRAKKNKTNKYEVLYFNYNLEKNITNIFKQLHNTTYKIGKYYTFIIYEPKERIIKSLPYKDRLVQQWYIEEFIKPYIVPRLINDTYSCIKDRGTHKAVYKLQYYMRLMNKTNPNYYVLKCDIHKFFYSINKDILFDIMKKYINDKKLLFLTRMFIYDNESIIGIPIGNYTSQYYANIYLNELDKYIKYDLNIKYYIRYMDDFILLLNTKEECKIVKNNINDYIINNLKLTLNPKSNYYPNKLGIDFCGYRIFNTHILLRKRSIKKIKQIINMWHRNKTDIKQVHDSYTSWLAHAKHASSYNLLNKINRTLII